MKCPHCLVSFFAKDEDAYIGEDNFHSWFARNTLCPNCHKQIIFLEGANNDPAKAKISWLVYPKGSTRPPIPPEVTDATIVEDYNEACLVLTDSPKASAALSRRCLQHVLQAKAGSTQKDLAPAIQEVIDSGKLPSHLSENIDAIRNGGNYAAHPMKNQATGTILDVEPNEAEWNLEVLEQLFDFYYVQPAIAKKKRDALNAKIATAGKPPMKS